MSEPAMQSLDVNKINAALEAQPGKSDKEKARDAGRKSAEVLAFLGAQPGDTVLDALASGGWYTEAMAISLDPDATIYAQNTPGNLNAATAPMTKP